MPPCRFVIRYVPKLTKEKTVSMQRWPPCCVVKLLRSLYRPREPDFTFRLASGCFGPNWVFLSTGLPCTLFSLTFFFFFFYHCRKNSCPSPAPVMSSQQDDLTVYKRAATHSCLSSFFSRPGLEISRHQKAFSVVFTNCRNFEQLCSCHCDFF